MFAALSIEAPLGGTCNEIFARNVKRYMEEFEISTNSVAMRTGMPQKTLWVTINEKNKPTLDTAHKICKALNIDLSVCISRPLTPHQVAKSKQIARKIDEEFWSQI